jgi:pentatricopeptide repeat protein
VIFRISAGFLVGALSLFALSLYLSDYYLGEQQRLAAAEDEEGAIGQVQVAERLDPFSPEPLQTESALLQQQGHNQAAAESLEQAAERDPHNYMPHMFLGFLQMNRLNDYGAATESFRKAQERNPNATIISNSLAQSLLRQGEYEEAARVYERMREDGQVTAENLYNLGRIYVRNGKPIEGRQTLQEARQLARKNIRNMPEGSAERAQAEELMESINLSIADALIVQGRYDGAYQVVANSSSDQAPAILALLESDPEMYRQSIQNGEIY